MAEHPARDSLSALMAAARALLERAEAGQPAAPERAELAELGRRLTALAGGAPGPDIAARAYFQYALTGMIETDGQWRILRANPAAASITGHNARNLAGQRLPDLLGSGEKSPGRHLAMLAEQGISQTEWQLRHRDDRAIVVELASVQVGEDHFIHVFDDVTDARRTQAEIEAARAAAEVANQAKSAFLANISHEIRTPMNGILGLARLALMTDLDGQQREYLEMISQSGQGLLRIINDLLDIAKIESGRMEYERIAFSPAELLDELATLAAHGAASAGKSLELVFRVSPGLPRRLAGDPLRIGQCLTNLVGNAVKFTPAGRVELDMAVVGTAQAPVLEVAVTDTGIGIAPEALARLFQPFSQSDAATARRFGGTGLGLAIAREMARGMGGELRVESRPGRGSRFCLSLPVAVPEPAPPPPAHGRRARLMIERPATRNAVAELLAAQGWSVAAKAEADDAPATAALLVFDCPGPDIDLAPVLARRNAPGQPVLVLTGGEPGARPARSGDDAEADAVAFVTRPLTPLALGRALARLGLAAGDAAGESQAWDVPEEFRGAHVLVAEDNRVNQLVIGGLLGKAGICVTLAENGRQAVARALAPPAPVDLVLMDVQMPEMDGIEATRALRQQGYSGPIVAVSAGAGAAEQARCREAGMNDFIAKPIDADELWGLFTCWIRPRDASPAEAAAESPEQRFLGNQAVLDQARRAFRADHGDDARRMIALLAAGDRPALARRAHALKGAAAILGLDAVAQLAARAEHAPDTDLPDTDLPDTDLPDTLARLSDTLAQALAGLGG